LWIFKTRDNDDFFIENTSKTKVLGATSRVSNGTGQTSDGKVILEDKSYLGTQSWKKGELDAEDYFTLEMDYFTLENSGVPKVLTAISESSLEISCEIIDHAGYDKLLTGPDDVGGICPRSTYQFFDECCCGGGCCWNSCATSSPPTNCLQGVSNSKWIFNCNLGYYQAFQSKNL